MHVSRSNREYQFYLLEPMCNENHWYVLLKFRWFSYSLNLDECKDLLISDSFCSDWASVHLVSPRPRRNTSSSNSIDAHGFTDLHLFSFLFLIFESFLSFENHFMHMIQIIRRRRTIALFIVRGTIRSKRENDYPSSFSSLPLRTILWCKHFPCRSHHFVSRCHPD